MTSAATAFKASCVKLTTLCDRKKSFEDNPLAKRGDSTADKLYVYKYVQPLRTADLAKDAARERKGKQLPLVTCEGGYCWV